jgi:hypothetical protein
MRTPSTLLLLLALSLPFGPRAHALVIEEASENDTRPADDPGWDNVGHVVTSLNATYLGYGWAVTAGHTNLGSGAATFDGDTYPIVPGSAFIIEHDATHDADLQVFRVFPFPRHLPVLTLATSRSWNDDVILIARGRSNGGPVGNPPTGYTWGPEGTKRWGTNELGATSGGSSHLSSTVAYGDQLTRSLFTQFDKNGSAFECAVAESDSGGALFIYNGGSWKLGGVAWATTGQVAGQSQYGDDTLSADLTYAPYQEQVLAITRPCDDGKDNDGDFLVDANDPGCFGEGDLSEEPACSDGIDNDADGQIDGGDADCSEASDLLEAPDADGDLVADHDDNCSETANPDQYDANLDGYGNACDADYNDDGVVGLPDFARLANAFGTVQGHPDFDPAVDVNGDGVIGLPEYGFLGSAFGGTPGPSGLDCAGEPPCF